MHHYLISASSELTSDAPQRFNMLRSLQSSTSSSADWTPSLPDAGWTGCWYVGFMWFPVLHRSLPSDCTLYKSNHWCDMMALISLDISAELWRWSPGSQLHHSPHRWRNGGLQRKRPRDSARHDCMHRLHTGTVPTTGQLYLSYLSLILRTDEFKNSQRL